MDKTRSADRIAQNLRNLRQAYGETQLELALAVGLNSPAAISNYESGTRRPKPEILKKLASHFRITAEALENCDCGSARKPELDWLDDAQKLFGAWLEVVPLFTGDGAIQSVDFADACAMHREVWDKLKRTGDCTFSEMEACRQKWNRLWVEQDIPEAAANHTAILVIYRTSMENPVPPGCRPFRTPGAELAKKACLRDESGEVPQEAAAPAFSEEDADFIRTELRNELCHLKAMPEWAELADFYTAFLYLHNCVENRLSADTNRVFAAELLRILTMSGNRYCLRLADAVGGRLFPGAEE